MSRVLPALILALLFAAPASAVTMYESDYEHFNLEMARKHMRDLVIYDAMLAVEDDGTWHLTAEAHSRARTWRTFSIDMVFSDVMSGKDFYAMAGGDEDRVMHDDFSGMTSDWLFARTVDGTITKTHGRERVFKISRYAEGNDYYAQMGTGLNADSDEMGFSTMLWVTNERDVARQAEMVLTLENPVPEPTAALLFGLGGLIAVGGSRLRRA